MKNEKHNKKVWKKCDKCGCRIYLYRPETHECNPAGIVAERLKNIIKKEANNYE